MIQILLAKPLGSHQPALVPAHRCRYRESHDAPWQVASGDASRTHGTRGNGKVQALSRTSPCLIPLLVWIARNVSLAHPAFHAKGSQAGRKRIATAWQLPRSDFGVICLFARCPGPEKERWHRPLGCHQGPPRNRLAISSHLLSLQPVIQLAVALSARTFFASTSVLCWQ